VADFGIARALDAAGGEKLTQTGLALGTPTYMSPEQAAASSRLDARSDIYALGCVVYEMLAGSPPFTGPTGQSILARHAVDPVPPLHTVRATVPEAVEEAIERALAKVPADRFATAGEFARALTAEQSSKRRRRRLLSRRSAAILTALGAIALVGLGSRTLRRPAAPAVLPSAATIAVLPFSASSGDTALSRLGRDLSVTLSASLNGVGGIQTADRLMVAAEIDDRGILSTGDGAVLARRLGAGSFTRGTLVRAGDQVRLDLGLYRTEGQAPLAEGIVVTGHRDSLSALTDSVAWRLLRQVWQRGDPPSPSLAAVTTRSLPALRAFLDGEQHAAAYRWGDAELAYGSAVAADSAFVLAFFGSAVAQLWQDRLPDPKTVEVLRVRGKILPERERLLVDAFITSGDSLSLMGQRLELVTKRFPGYWPGWFFYGDFLTHFGPFLGHDWSEALAAFRRVVTLNPNLVPVWEHVLTLAQGKDQTQASRAFDRLTALNWPPAGGATRLGYRLVHEIGRSNGMLRPELGALADSFASAIIAAAASGYLERIVVVTPLRMLEQGLPAAQIEINHRILRRPGVAPELRAALQAGNAWSWAARGQWDSALAGMQDAATTYPAGILGTDLRPGDRPGVVFQIEAYALAAIGAWLGAIDPGKADSLRAFAASSASRLNGDASRWAPAKVAWLDGLLAFVRGDRAAIQRARRAASETGYHQADLIDRSLAALDRAARGDRKGAGRDLAELEEYWAEREGGDITTPDMGVHRMAAAALLAESGDPERAIRLLRWQEARQSGWIWTSANVLAGPNYLARARLEETKGDSARALEYYNQFLRRYDAPTPSIVHLVTEARAATARLSGGR
jgi:serine/threonine-protein kinase